MVLNQQGRIYTFLLDIFLLIYIYIVIIQYVHEGQLLIFFNQLLNTKLNSYARNDVINFFTNGRINPVTMYQAPPKIFKRN